MIIFQILAAFSIGFVVVFYAIPVIVRISVAKSFLDTPNERKLNKMPVPNLGGIALFLGISIATLIGLLKFPFPDWRYISSGMMILFFIGFKDDILIIAPGKKFVAQLLVAFVMIGLGGIRVTDFHGLLGIGRLNYPLSFTVSTLFFVSTINAINLIDGIDGLAALLGLVSSIVFAGLFYAADQPVYSIMGMATAGSLSAFAIYNIYGRKNKIFMGDTGSLILGFLLSIFAVKINEIELTGSVISDKLPVVFSLALLAIPLFDMTRLFIQRILNGKSPFAPDKNHIHHKFLNLGLSHINASAIIVLMQSIVIATIFVLQEANSNIQLIILFSLTGTFLYLPDIILRLFGNSFKNKKDTSALLKMGTPNGIKIKYNDDLSQIYSLTLSRSGGKQHLSEENEMTRKEKQETLPTF